MASKVTKGSGKSKRIDSVGWGFWLICFLVLYGPFWYLGYSIAYEDRKGGLLPWGVGFMLAAFGAGLISLAVNFGLQKRVEVEKKRAHRKKR